MRPNRLWFLISVGLVALGIALITIFADTLTLERVPAAQLPARYWAALSLCVVLLLGLGWILADLFSAGRLASISARLRPGVWLPAGAWLPAGIGLFSLVIGLALLPLVGGQAKPCGELAGASRCLPWPGRE
jgi:hypothetical protein